MRAEGKKTIINANGKTEDIINAVVSVFGESWMQTSDIANGFLSDSVFETCKNIIDFVCTNFSYKVDPDGEQWIRTPNRILTDRQADCKSYSIFVCSLLENLGIKNGFRFASYSIFGNYTHVYSVAYDEYGNEIVIDCVAIQQGKKPFEEVKYKKQKTVMNDTTVISKLSGVNDVTINFSTSDSVAMIYAKSMLLRAIATKDSYLREEANAIIWTLQNFTTDSELDSVAYVFCKYQIDRNLQAWSNYQSLAKSFAQSESNPKSPYKRDIDVLEDPYYISLRESFQTNVIDCRNLYSEILPEPIISDLMETCFNTLYLFADSSKMTKTMKQKQENQVVLVNTLIAGSAISFDSAKNILIAAFAINYETSPEAVLIIMFPKVFKAAAIKGINVDPDNKYSGTTTTSNSTDKTKTVQKWIDTAVESFTKIWGAVTGNSTTNANKLVTPTYQDASGSTIAWAIFAAALAGGFYFIKRNKKSKK